jgi:tetratricopeptide (TPR) repeat protein
MNLNVSNTNQRVLLLVVALLAAVFLAYFSIRSARAIHFASLQTPEGLERAAQLEPRDARNWYLLGRYWQYNLENPDTPRAIREYLSSLAVNPGSADTWLDLAMAYETDGNIPAARDAFIHARKAYPLSPEGAWRYGNFLLRQGELQPAFQEMRHSVEVDPIRGAEAFSRSLRADSDIDEILNRVLPPIGSVYVDVIRDQVNEGNTDNALKVWGRLAAIHPRLILGDIFNFVDSLRTRNQISDARRVWDQAVDFAGFSGLQEPTGSIVWDGSFEAGLYGGGFAWLIPPDSPAVQIRLDAQEKRSGDHSLRVLFTGRSNVNFNGVCHYVPVEPSTSYQFSAWIHTRALTTDQGVRFQLLPIGDPAASSALTSEIHGTEPWTRIEGPWSSGRNTHLLYVCLVRLPSDQPQNKIRGTAWVDDVALVPASSERPKP